MGALYAIVRAYADAFNSGLVWSPQSGFHYTKEHLVWVVGADFEDAHKECEYLIGPDMVWLDDLGIIDRVASSISNLKDQKLILKTNIGVTFETVSAHDPLKIGREQPDGIIGCEVSRWPVEVWKRCYDRLQRKRGWGWFSGSPDTLNFKDPWMQEVFDQGQQPNLLDIRSYNMPTWANLALYPGGYNDPSIQQMKLNSTEVRFMERQMGLPAPPQNIVFNTFRVTEHVTDQAEFDPNYPVFLFIDPGTRCYCVLFVQFKEDEVHIVDEIYMADQPHAEIIRQCQLKPAWRNVDRNGLHAIDVAGTQRHMGMGTPVQAWQDLGLMNMVAKKRDPADGIHKIRSVMERNSRTGRPFLRVHPRCEGFIAECGGGRSPIEGGGAWLTKMGVPEAGKSAWDHACKALSYGLIAHFGTAAPRGVGYQSKGEWWERENVDFPTYLKPTPFSKGPNERTTDLLKGGERDFSYLKAR